jgi:Stage II sporulation protein E (SpoIIE)
LRRHLDDPGEVGLHTAYDLGRRALGDGMTLIELVATHHESRMKVLGGVPARLPDADAFLREALGAYEIAERGYWEAQRAAAVQRERVEVLGRLTDAHLGVMAIPTLRGRLREVCDRAMALVDGSSARLELGGPDREGRTVVERGDAGAEKKGEPVRVAVPARTGMGVLDVWPRSTRVPFGDADRAVLGQLALLASGAIDDAYRLEREHATSVQLQRSLLPGALPEVAHVALAARYVASEHRNQVGGDWYDVLELDDDQLTAVIGDVMGHGLREASIMAAMRVAFHAYSIDGSSAAAVVDRVDRLLSRLAPDHLATAVFCVLDLAFIPTAAPSS